MTTSEVEHGARILPRPLADGRARRPEVEAEITALLALARPALVERLRQAIKDWDLFEETLIYFARESIEQDRPLFLLACEALYLKVTPTLEKHAVRRVKHMRPDHAHDVFEVISRQLKNRSPALNYAERYFASYLRRRSSEVRRGSGERYGEHTEPIKKPGASKTTRRIIRPRPLDVDPDVDKSASTLDRLIRFEQLEEVWERLERLRPEVRQAFIQRRVLGLSVEQTAQLAGDVSPKTINNWVKLAEKALPDPDGV